MNFESLEKVRNLSFGYFKLLYRLTTERFNEYANIYDELIEKKVNTDIYEAICQILTYSEISLDHDTIRIIREYKPKYIKYNTFFISSFYFHPHVLNCIHKSSFLELESKGLELYKAIEELNREIKYNYINESNNQKLNLYFDEIILQVNEIERNCYLVCEAKSISFDKKNDNIFNEQNNYDSIKNKFYDFIDTVELIDELRKVEINNTNNLPHEKLIGVEKINWVGSLNQLTTLFKDLMTNNNSTGKKLIDNDNKEALKRTLIKTFLISGKEINETTIDNYFSKEDKDVYGNKRPKI